MRVTIVTETYYPQVNGVSRTLSQLVRVLQELGDQVQLIHPDYHQPTERPHDLYVRSINPPFYPELYVPLPPFGKVRRAIDQFRPDIVHIATEATLGLAVLRHTRRRLPVVSSFHTNFDQYTTHYRVSFTRGSVWRYLRWFHNETLETFVPSRTTIADLEKRGFKNLSLWPRGVDSNHFRPDRPGRKAVREALGFEPETPVVGHVSRIAAEKNVDYLGAALERVLLARPNCRALIVGDGPARAELEKRLGSHAQLVGYKTGDDLADHYAAADLFAFASLTETFGNVVLEAMASGLPVVAVRSGGPAEIVQDGKTGFLIEPDANALAFAEKVIELVDQAETRHRMAAQSREYACSQSWDTIMTGLRTRYEPAIARFHASV